MIPRIIVAALVWQSAGEIARGDEISGILKILGTNVNAEVNLTNTNTKEASPLCRGPFSTRMGRLTGMTVKISGTWIERNSKQRCLDGVEVAILTTGSGRKPIVGILHAESGHFSIVDKDSTTHKLEKIPPGLKKLLGRAVIVDVKSIEALKSGATTSWRVISYSEFTQ